MKFKIAIAVLGCLLGSQGIALAQDAAAGEKVFQKCRACHQVGENAKNAVGPVLNAIYAATGKPVRSLPLKNVKLA